VTSAAAHPSEPDRLPFADASPALIREALTPEDAAEFDRHWRQVMQRATERLDLAESARGAGRLETGRLGDLSAWRGHVSPHVGLS